MAFELATYLRPTKAITRDKGAHTSEAWLGDFGVGG